MTTAMTTAMRGASENDDNNGATSRPPLLTSEGGDFEPGAVVAVAAAAAAEGAVALTEEQLDWYGSSEDDEPPPETPLQPLPISGAPACGLSYEPEVWRVHLSASRVWPWLEGQESRQSLLDEWWKPRQRKPLGRPNPRLERGKAEEPKARELFAELTGLTMGTEITKAPLAEHMLYPYLAAKADGLIGENGVIEIKTPWSAREDIEVGLEIETKHLMQIMLQLECYDREYAILIMTVCDNKWLHTWKIERDRPEWHDDGQTLFDVCLPEFVKYRTAVQNGLRADSLDNVKMATLDCIRTKLREWKKHGLLRLHAMSRPGGEPGYPLKETCHWVKAALLEKNEPDFTVIDGFGPTTQLGKPTVDGEVNVRCWTVIWWHYEQPDDPAPKRVKLSGNWHRSGGYIRSRYYYGKVVVNADTTLKSRHLWLQASIPRR